MHTGFYDCLYACVKEIEREKEREIGVRGERGRKVEKEIKRDGINMPV